MTPRAGAVVAYATIGPADPEPLHGGGQGEIRSLARFPHQLLKTYTTAAPDVDGLVALVEWRHRLAPGDRRVVDARTSWPVAVVPDTPWGPGVVIPRAPKLFMVDVEGRRRARDLQFACVPAALWTVPALLSPSGAVTLTFRYAGVLDVLHRNDAVYGDLSHTNLLFGGSLSRPEIFLIDCDGAWVTTAPRPLPPAETANWIDPWPGDRRAEAERRRDLWKLSLLFVRTYYRSVAAIDGTRRLIELPPEPPITAGVRKLLHAGLARDGDRPTADEWMPALRRLHDLLRRRSVA